VVSHNHLPEFSQIVKDREEFNSHVFAPWSVWKNLEENPELSCLSLRATVTGIFPEACRWSFEG
jgi:hypothetical protein